MKKLIILVVLVSVLGISVVSAEIERVDNILVSIKVGVSNNNTSVDNVSVKINDIVSIKDFSNRMSESIVKYNFTYKPTGTYIVVDIPLEVTSKFASNGKFNGLFVKSDSWSNFNSTDNNGYYNFTLPFTITNDLLNSSMYGGFNKNDMKVALSEVLISQEFLDRLSKESKSSNEDFSSTFIQYFSNQYEPKKEELEKKEILIESLKNEVKSRDDRLTMMSINYTVAKSELDDAKTENMFLAFFSVILLVMMISLLAIKKGFIKTMRGVS